ncbi:hypothetical protein Pelo_15678 [Pelomyxa schiedti]|nr:hypothetical protein Pelo_15678 [Pelomyxa schiedti]
MRRAAHEWLRRESGEGGWALVATWIWFFLCPSKYPCGSTADSLSIREYLSCPMSWMPSKNFFRIGADVSCTSESTLYACLEPLEQGTLVGPKLG